MSQTSIISAALILGFIFYVVTKGEGPAYLATVGL